MSTKCFWCNGTGITPDDEYGRKKGDQCRDCKGSGFDTIYKDDLVCPHCGHAHSDSWELSDDDSSFECHSCSAKFQYETERSRTFTSWRTPCLDDPKNHQWSEMDFYKDKRKDNKAYAKCEKCREYKWIAIEELNK